MTETSMKNNIKQEPFVSERLKKEFQYYLDNQEKLVKKYNGKYLVIKDEKVVYTYDTYEDALFETEKKLKLGTFIIQLCTPGNDAYTQVFHSRVYFI